MVRDLSKYGFSETMLNTLKGNEFSAFYAYYPKLRSIINAVLTERASIDQSNYDKMVAESIISLKPNRVNRDFSYWSSVFSFFNKWKTYILIGIGVFILIKIL